MRKEKMTTRTNLTVLDLEGKIDFPNFHARNEVEVLDGDKTYVYVAEVERLLINSRISEAVEGLTTFSKYERKFRTKKKMNWSELKREEVSFTHDYLIWKIEGERNRWLIWNGNTCNNRDKDESYGYRTNLRNYAVNQGIQITPKLLDLAFDPIDQQIMALYQRIKRGELVNK